MSLTLTDEELRSLTGYKLARQIDRAKEPG